MKNINVSVISLVSSIEVFDIIDFEGEITPAGSYCTKCKGKRCVLFLHLDKIPFHFHLPTVISLRKIAPGAKFCIIDYSDQPVGDKILWYCLTRSKILHVSSSDDKV